MPARPRPVSRRAAAPRRGLLHRSFALRLLKFEKEVLPGGCRLRLLHDTGKLRSLLALQFGNASLRLPEKGCLDEDPSLFFCRGDLIEQPVGGKEPVA